MSFFEPYFAALDGPEPLSSLSHLAEDIEFSILWSEAGKTTEITGGKADLRAFVEAGDSRRKWRHHILWTSTDGDGEFAAGETRFDDGTKIGTFMVFGQLDADGRLTRYMAARTPVDNFLTLAKNA